MKNAKALIFPSKLYEGAPLTTKEALSLGIPCIVSDNCAAKDDILNNNGLLFNIEKKDLSKKIFEIIKNEIKYTKIKFDINDNYVNDIYKCYDEIINKK